METCFTCRAVRIRNPDLIAPSEGKQPFNFSHMGSFAINAKSFLSGRRNLNRSWIFGAVVDDFKTQRFTQVLVNGGHHVVKTPYGFTVDRQNSIPALKPD